MCDTQASRCNNTQERESKGLPEHSRSNSAGSADGLLLSVSALTGNSKVVKRAVENESIVNARSDEGSDHVINERKGENAEATENSLESEISSCNCDVKDEIAMGQGESRDMANIVRQEPEGIDESDTTQSLASFLSVDKRVFGRLQEELTQAQSELKLKEEQVLKLSRIRDDVERELEDLTASLFQEAHKMVQEANIKRAQAEKALAESEMKVDGLTTEVAALKALVITSTPSMPNKHLHPHLGSHHSSGHRLTSDGTESAPSSPCKDNSLLNSSIQDCDKDQRNIDPVLRAEYLTWKKSPSMNSTSPFLGRIYKEDVDPCLDFPAKELSDAVRDAIHENILCLTPCKPDTGENPRNCALLDQPRTARYKLRIEGRDSQEHFISQLARNRVAAVCDFLTYCRYVTQGMVKSPVNDVYWEIMELRRKMTIARLGFSI